MSFGDRYWVEMDKRYDKNIKDMTYRELLTMIKSTKEGRKKIYEVLNKIPEGWDGRK